MLTKHLAVILLGFPCGRGVTQHPLCLPPSSDEPEHHSDSLLERLRRRNANASSGQTEFDWQNVELCKRKSWWEFWCVGCVYCVVSLEAVKTYLGMYLMIRD